MWFAQWILAYIYGSSGIALTSQPILALAMMGARYAIDYPELFTRLVGVVQILGAVGIVLPALTRIAPALTPAAALCLSVMQLAAIAFLASRGELGSSAPANAMLLCLSLLVLWGRTAKVPIPPRSGRASAGTTINAASLAPGTSRPLGRMCRD